MPAVLTRRILLMCIAAFSVLWGGTFVAAADGIQPGDKILVIGGTGRTGRLIVEALDQQTIDVAGLTRDASKAKANISSDYNWVQGDVRDKDSLVSAMAGVDLVVFAASASFGGGEGNVPETVDNQGVKHATDVAKAAGARHMILISSVGVTDKDHPMNKAMNNMLLHKWEGEEYLRSSGLPYTIIRPGGLIDTLQGPKGVFFSQGDIVRSGLIRRKDLVPVIVGALGNADAFNKTFEVFGFDSGTPGGAVPQGGAGEWPVSFADLTPDTP